MFLILECKNYICIYLELLFCIGNTVCDNDFEIILKILSFSGIIASIITILIVKITMVTEVVAALVWRDDKFMICQRPAHKARGLLWEFVGGKVEPREPKEQWFESHSFYPKHGYSEYGPGYMRKEINIEKEKKHVKKK